MSVTLFRKVADEFKTKAREKKFYVRDFVYNLAEMEAGESELTKLKASRKKAFSPLVRWLKINFSEVFMAWIHIKVRQDYFG